MNGQNKKATPAGGSHLFDFVAQALLPVRFFSALRFCWFPIPAISGHTFGPKPQAQPES
jgi:hypothetical protein